MKIPFLSNREIITASEIFRVASLFLYTTLLLHVALSAHARHLLLSGASIAAVSLLTALLFIATARYLWPGAVAFGQKGHVAELFTAVAVLILLTSEGPRQALSLPWLIGVAGVFPLVIEGGVAIAAIVAIALAGAGLNIYFGVRLVDWLPQAFATLFVGLLALMLSRALRLNLSAIVQARRNDLRFEAIARATRHVFLIATQKYKIKYVNPAIQDILGYTPEEIERNAPEAVVHPDDIKEHQEKLRFLRDTPKSSIFSRHRTRHKNGQWVWLETSGFNMLHEPAINGLVFSIEDISARKDAELKLEQEHALLRAVLDLNPSMIYAKDTEGRFTISNRSFQRQFGYSSEEDMRGRTAYEVFPTQAAEGQELGAYEMADKLHLQDLHVMESGLPLEDLEIQGLRESDTHRWYRTNKYPLRDVRGEIVGLLGITRDITDRKEYEMRLEYQALHDPLTGLPNRRFLLNTITAEITKSLDKHAKLAMLFCDLDFFKSVNDTHGHDFGDQCLMELTRRILAVLPAQDFVARFGGNEFVILAKGSLREAKAKAETILQEVSHPLVVDETVVKIHTSIGIALLSANHQNPSDLIRDADAAMYQAKERGRNRAEIFNASLQNNTTKRAQMDVALRFALERDELALVYQPKISILDGSVKGFELLLRWNSPEYGHISPTDFIPIAEASGLVVPIGIWALEEACKQLRTWQSKYPELDTITVAVNVSMRQLLQASFLPEVIAILKSTRVLAHTVELELTETSVMANPLQTIKTLTALKKLGLRLALDDFGTGYSSLAYLQKLPIDVLKIDKAFVHGLGNDSGDAEIVRLILALAQTLNLETVAEGVETPEHIAELKKMGCYLAQGYVFSAPISADEADELLRSARRFSLP